MMLTAYTITYDNGDSFTTSMAAGITLKDARAYFLGRVFVDEDQVTGGETRRRVVRVEPADSPLDQEAECSTR